MPTAILNHQGSLATHNQWDRRRPWLCGGPALDHVERIKHMNLAQIGPVSTPQNPGALIENSSLEEF